VRLQEEGNRVFVLATSDRVYATLPRQIPVQHVTWAFNQREVMA
jgi:hypothetical protein